MSLNRTLQYDKLQVVFKMPCHNKPQIFLKQLDQTPSNVVTELQKLPFHVAGDTNKGTKHSNDVYIII